MDRYLDNFKPSIQEVKEWAYDDSLYFTQQDEDLALHSTEYISTLMELASDQECPKNGYCLSILTYYSQILLANRMLKEIKEVKRQIAKYDLPLNDSVENWKSDFLYLTDLIYNPRPITESEADKVAWRLTVGDYCIRDFKKLGLLYSDILEYSASTTSYIEYFYINPRTANWKLSKYFRLSDTLNL
ncbi:hypothetical protein [Terrimonas alba]|uniref:hypothetical protein n=1 Tax=Terrimonas alba TaxID=3349636 RepID=UPI0035F32072